MTIEDGKREIDRELKSFVSSLPRSTSGDLQALIERFKSMQKSVEKFKKRVEPKINSTLSQIQVDEDKLEDAKVELESYLHKSVAKTMEGLVSR